MKVCPYWREEYGCEDECFISKMEKLEKELAALKSRLAEAERLVVKLTDGVSGINEFDNSIYCALCGNTRYHFGDCPINSVLLEAQALFLKGGQK